MELRILGPLEVAGENGPVDLRAAKHRRLLAALTLARGQSCTADALVDAVWGASPPASARKLLQVYVSQLRKALPSREALVTTPSGYALRSEHVSLDADRFERLLDDGVEALAQRQSLARALAARSRTRALARVRVCRRDVRGLRPSGGRAARRASARGARGAARSLGPARPERGGARRGAGDGTRAPSPGARAGRRDAGALPGRAPDGGTRPLRRAPAPPGRGARARAECRASHAAAPHPPAGSRARVERLARRRRERAPRAAEPACRTRSATWETWPRSSRGATCGCSSSPAQEEAARRASRSLPLGRPQSSFANGAVIVELAPLRDPGLLLPTIASAIGVAEVPGQAPLDTLAAAMSNRELLLVLDNVEHLSSATPALVELLARAPRLVLLVTSRAVLHLTGEHVFPVSPLDDDAAVELFEQRARALQPDFELTAENETHGPRDLQARRRPAACDRARSRADQVADPAGAARAARAAADRADGRAARPAGPPADASRDDRLERRAPERRRASSARPAVGGPGRCDGRGRGSRLRNPPRRALDADRPSPRPARGHARAGRDSRCSRRSTSTPAELLAADPADADRARAPARGVVPRVRERGGAAPEPGSTDRVARPPRDRARQPEGRARPPRVLGRRASSSSMLAVSLSRFWYVRGHLAEGRARLEHALEATADRAPGSAPPSLHGRRVLRAAPGRPRRGDPLRGRSARRRPRGGRSTLRRQRAQQPGRDPARGRRS